METIVLVRNGQPWGQPWISKYCPKCRVRVETTEHNNEVNFCYSCGQKIEFNNYHTVLNHPENSIKLTHNWKVITQEDLDSINLFNGYLK